MATLETGKQRASRIPLDYFRHGDWLTRSKRWLALVLFVAAVVWAVGGFLRSDAGNMRYSRGPVAAVHAAWDAECSACHAPFAPMSSENWLHATGRDPHVGDQRCQTCHAGPEHHATQRLESTPSCAACHRDHRGRDAMLTRIPDSQCVVCHGQLGDHTKTGQPAYVDKITGFARDHPEFKLLRDGKPVDPGRIKFNHKLHMTAGQVKVNGAQPWTLARIEDKELRERYRAMQDEKEKADSSPVQLACASCHQLDSGDFGLDKDRRQFAGLPLAALLPTRSAGAQMLPITYENQCKACHALTVEVGGEVPHRLQLKEIHTLLEGRYAQQYLLENKLVGDRPLPSRPLPGARLLDPGEEKKARAFIEERVAGAERRLYPGKMTCGECHFYDSPVEAPNFPRKGGVDAWAKVEASSIPTVWFVHGRFDHSSHRAMNCRECHARAYADAANASTDHAEVLVPGIDNCKQCHAPRSGSGGSATGGVRFTCTECHTYHHGDGTLQGIGAAARNPRDPRLKTQEFLSGMSGR